MSPEASSSAPGPTSSFSTSCSDAPPDLIFFLTSTKRRQSYLLPHMAITPCARSTRAPWITCSSPSILEGFDRQSSESALERPTHVHLDCIQRAAGFFSTLVELRNS